MAADFEQLMSSAAKKYSAAGYLFYCPDDQTIFLTRRSSKSKNPGTWDVSGGRADKKDDAVEDTAAREVYEELSNLPEKKKFIGKHIIRKTKKHKNDYVIFIYAISKDQKKNWKPKLSKEHDKWKWFDVKNLPKKLHFEMNWIEEFIDK